MGLRAFKRKMKSKKADEFNVLMNANPSVAALFETPEGRKKLQTIAKKVDNAKDIEKLLKENNVRL